MGTVAIKHPVPDRVNPSFVIFDIQALTLSLCIRITVGLKGLINVRSLSDEKCSVVIGRLYKN